MARVAITEQYLTDIADAIRSKTGMPSAMYYPSEMADAIMTISGGGGITPTGTISITENGTYNVTSYASADVNVPTGSTINNQDKIVTPSASQQTITADSGYTGLGTVTVNGDEDLIASNIKKNVSIFGVTGTYEAGSSSPTIQSLTVTPSESQQIFNASSVDGYKPVTVGAISSTYVGSGITRRTSDDLAGALKTSTYDITVPAGYYASDGTFSIARRSASNLVTSVESGYLKLTYDNGYYPGGGKNLVEAKSSTDLTVSGATVTVPAGYYASAASKSVSSMTLPTSAASSSTSGYTSKATISRSASAQYINIPPGYNNAGAYYEVEAVANGTAGTPVATKGTVSNNSISVTPSVTNSTGYITGGTKTGTAVTVTASELVSGTLEIINNGTEDVTNYKNVTVNVPTGSTINNQNKSVTPTESQQSITADSGYTGLGTVTVDAISRTYIGSAVRRLNQSDFTVDGDTITVPVGYVYATASKSVTTMTLPTTVATSATSGYTRKIQVGRSTSTQYINIDPGYNSAGGYYEITATPNGSVTAPSSISGSSATVTTGTNTLTFTKTVSVTPNVTTAGYISSGTAGNSSVSLTANVTVDPTPTASGATVTIPSGYYTDQTTKSVTTMTLPTSASSSATSGYTKKATISRSTSAQYINIAPGYNSAGGYYEISAVANGSATGPTSLSGSSATVTTGTNTITLTKTGVTTTPTVSAGYVSSATASTATVALTASVTTKAAATYTPGTTNQTIAAGTYLTGTQTIAGDEDLVASNIVNGVQIFGVTGNVVLQNYYTGSSAPSSSLGQNGDIYIQQ